MIDCNSPALKSWVPVSADSHFPIQNLPFGIFKTLSRGPRVGVAIGNSVLDLAQVASLGYFKNLNLLEEIFSQDSLNPFLSQGKKTWRAVRHRVAELLWDENKELRDNSSHAKQVLLDSKDVTMMMPVRVTNYVDFYSSLEHATNVGKMFRPDSPLLPNWKHIPIGYHGRSSSLIVSGTPIKRPSGQIKPQEENPPIFEATRQLDFELETAFIAGKKIPMGNPIFADEAEDAIFGMALLNDWSARDIQKWEYVPLGPFLGKSFATTLSPWIVTLDALAPFKVPGPIQDPQPLPYLNYSGLKHYDIHLEVHLKSQKMSNFQKICTSNFKYMYWSMAQQLAHMASNGSSIEVGDVYGSGTISGQTEDSLGSMLELAWKGTRPIHLLETDEKRTFIQNGDTVKMIGYCQNKNEPRIGFGECVGEVVI